MTSREEMAKKLEYYETPLWCIERILEQGVVGEYVWDACCGDGTLARAAKRHGHAIHATDIYDWGYGHDRSLDFLKTTYYHIPFPTWQTALFINPPFSKAKEFVEHGLALGIKNIVVFQRFAWLESVKRREFWDQHCPKEIFLCGSRATCWLHSIPDSLRGSSTTTAHAWFVFDDKTRAAASIRRIYK